MAKKRINSKAKGCRVERAACKYLATLGFEARRSQQYKGTADSFDLECDGLPFLNVEVKGREDYDLGTKALADACVKAAEDAGPSKAWCVLWKRNGTKWRLTLPTHLGNVTVCGDEDVKRCLLAANRTGAEKGRAP